MSSPNVSLLSSEKCARPPWLDPGTDWIGGGGDSRSKEDRQFFEPFKAEVFMFFTGGLEE